MLGRTANGLFWMSRYIERAENTARLLDAGLRIALTKTDDATGEWQSVLSSAGVADTFAASGREPSAFSVADYLLRADENSSSVLNCMHSGRDNGRMVRTALTREAWESLNSGWLALRERLSRPVPEEELPDVLDQIKRETALFRGALVGTMLVNELYDFSRLGTFIERADYTSRILDVKYYVLLPGFARVGSSLDNYQWESILRSVSAHRSFTWAYESDYKPWLIADFLILNPRMPRSLAFSYNKIVEHLQHLENDGPCHASAVAIRSELQNANIDAVFATGLHEFLTQFISRNNALSGQISEHFRFMPD